ncbi:radical SAM protein [Candidatus Woesearchaeota archaeon]|nr:radical SAM protein [Candidatus Woesearchaeota archaeon]
MTDQLVLAINMYCNLECKFCYADGHPGRKESLSLEQFITLIDSDKPKSIDISGGEPFMNSQLNAMLEYAISDLNVETILISTNGTMYRQDLSKILKNQKCELQVSLPAIDEEVWKSITKPSNRITVNRVKENIERWLQEDVRLHLSMPVYGENKDEIEKVVDYATAIGVGVRVTPVFRVGRGKNVDGLSGMDKTLAVAFLNACEVKGLNVENSLEYDCKPLTENSACPFIGTKKYVEPTDNGLLASDCEFLRDIVIGKLKENYRR